MGEITTIQSSRITRREIRGVLLRGEPPDRSQCIAPFSSLRNFQSYLPPSPEPSPAER